MMTETKAEAGVVEIPGANAVWIDPVAVLNQGYSQYRISYNRYFSRTYFQDSDVCAAPPTQVLPPTGNSRKRKRKTVYKANEKELQAELRHEESRQAILKAHSLFLKSRPLQTALSPALEEVPCRSPSETSNAGVKEEVDFVGLANLYQAPLYELNILSSSSHDDRTARTEERWPLFGSVCDNGNIESLAECEGHTFILPRQCSFLTSDISNIHLLVPGSPSLGYNLILMDPPWENKSVHRRSLYPTLPNRQLLYLPVKKLVHREGALLALWITNREKLHQFVEKELFPAWQVEPAACWYWLKLKFSGEMISPLDMQHHKPYERLLLGYIPGCARQENSTQEIEKLSADSVTQRVNAPSDKFVVMSIPGDHSRKPPIYSLLREHAPGPHPVNALELFARELTPGWTSWGNEPLRFQDSGYFKTRSKGELSTEVVTPA